MKLSRFNVVVDNYPLPGHYLLLNTMTKAVVVLNQELLEYLGTLEGINDLNELQEEAREHVKQLMSMQMVCLDSRNETDYLYYWLNSQRYDQRSLLVTILTTYKCNLACPYCYEHGIGLSEKMTPEVQEDTYNWVAKKVQEQNPKLLKVTFLGGEPTLNSDAIDNLATKFHALSEEKGFKFNFHLVTNGVLLTTDKVKRWMELGMNFVQITIDGVKEVHDTMRPFAGGAGSFDIIMQRVTDILREVPDFRIAIRINCDRNNYQRVPELLDYLATLEGKERLFISFGHLVPYYDESDTQVNENLFKNSEEDGKIEVYLARETKKRGFRLHDRTFNGPCMAVRRGAFLIDPIGEMYNCWNFVGHKEFVIGSIYEEQFSDFYHEIIGYDLMKECLECPYVPICLGGCRDKAIVYNKDAKSKYCHSYFMGENGKELLKYYFAPDEIQKMAQEAGYEL